MAEPALSSGEFAARLAQWGYPVSRETLTALEIYADLLTRWQARINLVATESLKALWHRHMLDSAQALPLLPAEDGSQGEILDLGSGAGFPGFVLALLTGRPLAVIESDQRKCAFLAELGRQTGIAARLRLFPRRIESVAPWPAPILTARALAALPILIGWAAPFFGSASLALFWKGRTWREELTAASRDWNITAEDIPSRTDPDSAILVINQIKSKA